MKPEGFWEHRTGEVLLWLVLHVWTENTTFCGLPLTFLTSWHITAPSEIPLTHEDLGACQLISRVTLVGDDGAVDEVRVGRALPAVGDLRQLRAGVISRHLCWHWSSWCCIVLVGEERDRMGNDKLRITDILPIYVDTMRKDNGTGNTIPLNNSTFFCIMNITFTFFIWDQDCKGTHDEVPQGNLSIDM